MSKPDLIVWSAMFARTNMGLTMPTVDEIRCYRASAAHGSSLESMINMVCADFIEEDEHYGMFLDEARGWYKTLRLKDVDYVLTTWSNKRAPWEASA